MWNRAGGLFDTEFPYLEISSVGLGTNEYTLETVPVKDAPSRARMVLRGNDLVISTTRPHRGAVALIQSKDSPCIGSTGFAVIRNIADDVDRGFLLHAVTSQVILKQFLRRSSGGSYPAITLDEMRLVQIPTPPLDTQCALVAEMEAARESRRGKFDQADGLIKSLDRWLLAQLGLEPPPTDSRQSFAVRLGDIRGRVDPYFYQPRFEKVMRALAACRYRLQTIGGLCEPPVGGATPLRSDTELYAEGGVKFLRILNVKPNEIDLTDVKYIRDTVHTGDLSRSQLADDDVLLTITGRVGTAAVVPKNILPANINQHLVRLRIVSNDCLPDYLAAYLNTSVGLAVSNRNVTGGTRMALDYQAIRSLPVPIPPKDIQRTIIEAMSRRRADAHRLRAEAEAEWQAAKERFEQQLLAGGRHEG